MITDSGYLSTSTTSVLGQLLIIIFLAFPNVAFVHTVSWTEVHEGTIVVLAVGEIYLGLCNFISQYLIYFWKINWEIVCREKVTRCLFLDNVSY